MFYGYIKKIYRLLKKLLLLPSDFVFQNKWKANKRIRCDSRCSTVTRSEICGYLKKENEVNIKIAPVYMNKSGIITIISDDGEYETSKKLNEYARVYSIPITIAVTVKNVSKNVEYWKTISEEGVIDIVNHSYNHIRMDDGWKYSSNEKRLIHEIVHSRIFLENQLGLSDRLFVCPENALSEMGYTVLKEDGVIAVRKGIRGYNSLDVKEGIEPGDWFNLKCYGIMDQPIGFSSRKEMRSEWLKKAASGKWLIEMWHNVDIQGYQSVKDNEAREHLEEIVAHDDDLWIASFSEATKYIRFRQNAKVISWIADDKLNIIIYCNLYNLNEVTILIPTGNWKFKDEMPMAKNTKDVQINIAPNKLYTFGIASIM